MYGFKSSVQELFLHQDGCQDNLLILALLKYNISDIFIVWKNVPKAGI